MIKVAKPYVTEREVEAIREVLFSGRYLTGPKVEEFEQKFADYIGVEHSVAVNSGTAALHVSLAVLGVGPGDEVIVPPLTFFSTVSSVLHQNAIPVFGDIDPDSYCLDPEDVKKRITENTKAIIPVHLFGNAANMEELLRVAKENDLYVIEDAAQAHGTEYKGEKVGSIGDIGTFSFYATKHMTTGEGGMLVTDNGEWAKLARNIRSHGMTDRDHHDYLGYNYRMNEIAAAMGIVQLERLDDLNEKRIKNSKYLLGRLRELKIPWLTTPRLESRVKHTFFWCPVLIDEKKLGMGTKRLREKLYERGIETRHRYHNPLYKQKVLTEKNPYPEGFPYNSKHYDKNIDYQQVYLETAEKVAGKLLGLPNHPGLGQTELDAVIDSIRSLEV
ncbi:DegT/DnrJ/EryC1/StrS family aminotransferase [Candidatus Bipolaricaulota bacterium]|nr:DegT/DnrJ/EryC1/StrS family aminotransferase [Candidatus Bipolaricaulota bacterium]